jgi:hypothetical protein
VGAYIIDFTLKSETLAIELQNSKKANKIKIGRIVLWASGSLGGRVELIPTLKNSTFHKLTC